MVVETDPKLLRGRTTIAHLPTEREREKERKREREKERKKEILPAKRKGRTEGLQSHSGLISKSGGHLRPRKQGERERWESKVRKRLMRVTGLACWITSKFE